MKVLRIMLDVAPYVLVALCCALLLKSNAFLQDVETVAARAPNPETGETWLVHSGGEVLYLTSWGYGLFNAPILLAPVAFFAGMFILRDLLSLNPAPRGWKRY